MHTVRDKKQYRNEVKIENALLQSHSSNGITVRSLESSLSVVFVHLAGWVLSCILFCNFLCHSNTYPGHLSMRKDIIITHVLRSATERPIREEPYQWTLRLPLIIPCYT